jgi:hypothetical protein
MPLFFCLPMIIWMGLFGVAQDALVPIKLKSKR